MTRQRNPIFAATMAAGLLASFGGVQAQSTAPAASTPGATQPASPALTVRPMDRAPAAAAIPDGAPGNPPGTALGRTVDRATGTVTVPDGAVGNPPGTAAGRTVDRATGGPATPGTTATVPRELTSVTTAGNAAVTYRPRASQLIGSNVYNDRDESIGEVEDLVLSPSGDRPMAVIQVGGFLGIGGRLVSMPLSELGWNPQRERITLPGATKEQLQARPVFTYETPRRG